MNTDRNSLYFNEPVVLETPYKKARQHWDQRIGSARVQAANWRLIALLMAVLLLFCLGIIAWQMQSSRLIPYVVEVSDKGHIRAIGPAEKHYRPKDEQIAFHLADFITHIRSLPADPVIVRQNWLKAYAFVTGHAATTLSDHARKNNPFKQLGSRTVAVEILSVVRASKDSFQVRWKETVYLNGSADSTTPYTALLTITLQPPVRKNILMNNPLGIFIKDLNWSAEPETGVRK